MTEISRERLSARPVEPDPDGESFAGTLAHAEMDAFAVPGAE